MSKKKPHDCKSSSDTPAWYQAGSAIDYCNSGDHGFFWAGNGEYESQVAYCPFCGEKAWREPVSQEEWEKIMEAQKDE